MREMREQKEEDERSEEGKDGRDKDFKGNTEDMFRVTEAGRGSSGPGIRQTEQGGWGEIKLRRTERDNGQ